MRHLHRFVIVAPDVVEVSQANHCALWIGVSPRGAGAKHIRGSGSRKRITCRSHPPDAATIRFALRQTGQLMDRLVLPRSGSAGPQFVIPLLDDSREGIVAALEIRKDRTPTVLR